MLYNKKKNYLFTRTPAQTFSSKRQHKKVVVSGIVERERERKEIEM